MRLFGIDIAYQTDPLYMNEIMTYPSYQTSPDIIKQYGCLLCAKLNAYNLFNKDKIHLTIKDFNELIKKHNGYNYLFYMNHNNNDIEKTKKDCFGKESFQIPAVINWILGIKEEYSKYQGIIDIESANDYYIIKTPFQNTGHYSLVIEADKTYLDSYDGQIKHPTTILDIIKITFKDV
jgi:hypothetical protein